MKLIDTLHFKSIPGHDNLESCRVYSQDGITIDIQKTGNGRPGQITPHNHKKPELLAEIIGILSGKQWGDHNAEFSEHPYMTQDNIDKIIYMPEGLIVINPHNKHGGKAKADAIVSIMIPSTYRRIPCVGNNALALYQNGKDIVRIGMGNDFSIDSWFSKDSPGSWDSRFTPEMFFCSNGSDNYFIDNKGFLPSEYTGKYLIFGRMRR